MRNPIKINKIPISDAAQSKRSVLLSLISTGSICIYNLLLGIYRGSAWSISAGMYYLFVVLLRSVILLFRYSKRALRTEKDISAENKLFRAEFAILIFMDIALAAPTALMVLAERDVSAGTITAIAIAAYTAYRVVRACIRFRGAARNRSPLFYMMRTLEIKDTVFSVLLLQSTLITVFGDPEEMLILTSYTSAFLLALNVFMTINLGRKHKKLLRETENN